MFIRRCWHGNDGSGTFNAVFKRLRTIGLGKMLDKRKKQGRADFNPLLKKNVQLRALGSDLICRDLKEDAFYQNDAGSIS